MSNIGNTHYTAQPALASTDQNVIPEAIIRADQMLEAVIIARSEGEAGVDTEVR